MNAMAGKKRSNLKVPICNYIFKFKHTHTHILNSEIQIQTN